MKKRLLTGLLATTIALASFNFGCSIIKDPSSMGQGGQGVFENINLDAGSDYSGTLKIAYMNAESEQRAMDAFITSFKIKYPNITVKATPLNGGNYSSSLLNVARSATQLKKYDQMYDLFWLPQDYVNSFYQSDVLFPIGKIVNADKNVSVDDLVDLALEVSSVNDTLYMMPRDYNQVVMYFNKDIFDAADMAYPENGMSRTQFTEMLGELKTKISKSTAKNSYGQYYRDMPFLVDSNVCWDSLSWPLLKSFGAEVVNEDGEVTFDSDKTYQAIDYWKTLIKDGYACQIGAGKSGSGKQFSMQNSAVFFHTRAQLTDIYSADLDNGIYGIPNLGVVSLPDFSDNGNYYVGAGSSGYAMYSNSVNATASWLFLKHIISTEGQEAYSKTGNCVPVLKSMLDEENAVWKTWATTNVAADFNNDAFTYKIDGATTTRDFYRYVPVVAQSEILNCIDEAFTNMIASVTDIKSREMITNAAKKMQTAIAQAK